MFAFDLDTTLNTDIPYVNYFITIYEHSTIYSNAVTTITQYMVHIEHFDFIEPMKWSCSRNRTSLHYACDTTLFPNNWPFRQHTINGISTFWSYCKESITYKLWNLILLSKSLACLRQGSTITNRFRIKMGRWWVNNFILNKDFVGSLSVREIRILQFTSGLLW